VSTDVEKCEREPVLKTPVKRGEKIGRRGERGRPEP